MKTFNDLKFEPHTIIYNGESIGEQAVEHFDNGYGVSVLLGEIFYSNGIDTYELAVLYHGNISYNNGIVDGVIGYISSEEVTDIMLKVQKLPT